MNIWTKPKAPQSKRPQNHTELPHIGALWIAFGLFVSACTTANIAPASTEPLLQTTSGALQGVRSDNVIIFKGIPYAKPPIGDGRWSPPQPTAWSGVKSATDFSAACLQNVNEDGTPNYGGYAGPVSENCLYLNIWAPVDAENAPVMVWLYGGGGVVGAASIPTYDGTAFARDGVILVSLNYRHGSLAGFAHPALSASFDDAGVRSNFQLQDTAAALQWVQDNISALGGDTNNVTLFGESAGATMTANLVTSPIAEGLFSKAIFESTGSLATPGTSLQAAEKLGSEIATAFGFDGPNATLAELKSIDGSALIASRKLGFGLRTVIDGTVKKQSILESFQSGTQNDVLLMLGTNSDEGRLSGTRRIADLAEKTTPVFHYFFDYVPNALRSENPNGAPHAGELPFVFDTLANYPGTKGQITAEDQHMADLTHQCWVAFAKADRDATVLNCGGLEWPARVSGNGKPVAILKPQPALANADALKSPPNGAAPGRTSRDDN